MPLVRPFRLIASSVALMALSMFIFLALTNTAVTTPRIAEAGGYSPWLYLDCSVKEVSEGDEFRHVVRTKYDTNAFSKPMSVYWYTDPGTADDSDYERLYAEGQVSNGSQSRSGKMGRTFFTREDTYPELDETYTVRFNNTVDYGTDGSCPMTILDDDGVGIYDLEIRSVPFELPAAHQGEGPRVAYTTGDVILITARFNHPVTTVNPKTGERANYTGLFLKVGENRRFARLVRGDGTDTLIFGYTVLPGDVDHDGVSVESGGAVTGLNYHESTRDSGLWAVNYWDGRLNRLFHGLDDDPAHPVVQVDIGEPTVTPPVDPPTEGEIPPVDEWVAKSVSVDPNLVIRVDGELTEEDGGRDWYSFEAVVGEDYIVELTNKMNLREDPDGFHISYVPGHLADPSILEIVDVYGTQVLGERDGGGFTANFARAFFTPESDGTYYVAVGAGREHRAGLGFYTVSVRRDDHPNDYRTRPGAVLVPGGSVMASIDSDVPNDHPGLNPWDWREVKNTARPVFGIESLDDLDVFRLVISAEGTYRVSVSNGPETVGVWAVFDRLGNTVLGSEARPESTFDVHLKPGNYSVAVGTSYESEGNTGDYEVSFEEVTDSG